MRNTIDRDDALRLLRSGRAGVARWNAIQTESVVVTVAAGEFPGPRLEDSDLSGLNLDGVLFLQTDLRRSNLSESSLRNAHFGNACLRKARLDGCNLSGANLINADLRGASLGRAILMGTLLHGTRCSDTQLSGAEFRATSIATDLTVARGLQLTLHRGPSQIALSCFESPQRPWPHMFLRGCGLSNIEIETLTAFSGSAIQYFSAFISHSAKDDTFAVKLHDALQARGIRCWLDTHEILPGDNIYRAVNEGIRLWDKVLLCCSEPALTSWWVKREVEHAFEKERRLSTERRTDVLATIPLDLDGYLFSDACTFEHKDQLRARHAPPFKGWQADEKLFDAQVARIVAALRADDHARSKPPLPKL